MPYQSKIHAARVDECSHLKWYRTWVMVSMQLGRASPIIAACVTFVSLAALGRPMRPSDVFASLSVFLGLRLSLIMIPQCLSYLGALQITVRRLRTYLLLDEFATPAAAAPPDAAAPVAIAVDRASFAWPGSSSTLGPLTFCVGGPARQLVAVVGAVGAGKTSLLSALVGEMPRTAGALRARASLRVGYVSQKPVVLTGSIRDNIVMGRAADASALAEATAFALLGPDVALFDDGLDTVVGERGVTLSGG